MSLEEIIKIKLKRVNPFQGLVIDSDTWRDAHDYHRAQQKLHLLVFHDTGIAEGLEITASNPPDLSVNIHPGMAVDPEGNVLLIAETQNYRIQTREKRTIYLTVQFREVPAEPYQPREGGQPTRIVDGYRIQERDKPPDGPYIELCRINFDPTEKVIRDAKFPSQIAKNEIDIGYRKDAKAASSLPVEPVPGPNKPGLPVASGSSAPVKTVAIGHVVLGEANRKLHVVGLQNLLKTINHEVGYAATLAENILIDKKINRFTLLYLTGNNRFEMSAEQQAALGDFLQSGGVIFAEGCNEESSGPTAKGSKEFGLAFNQLANHLKCKLEVVQRGHPLLSAYHIFAEVPQGVESAMLLEGGQMVYSAGDYGCAWQGGYQGKPLSRENIRAALEMGINLSIYSQANKAARG